MGVLIPELDFELSKLDAMLSYMRENNIAKLTLGKLTIELNYPPLSEQAHLVYTGNPPELTDEEKEQEQLRELTWST